MALDIFDIARSQGIDPGLYNRIQPFVQQTVGNYGAGRNLTEADISRMTDDIVFGSRRHGLPFTGYGGRSLNDFARLLVLLNLYNYGYNLNPFWQLYYGGIPFFLSPFLGGGHPPYVRPAPPIGGLRPGRPHGHPPHGFPRRRRPRR